jgi:hypothetical protein
MNSAWYDTSYDKVKIINRESWLVYSYEVLFVDIFIERMLKEEQVGILSAGSHIFFLEETKKH